MDSNRAEKRLALNGGTAVLTAVNGEVDLTWEGADGKPRAGVPASLKQTDPEGVERAKRIVKDIRADLVTWKTKIEASYLDDVKWPYDVWRMRYADHGTLSLLSRRLIWSVEDDGRTLSVLPTRDGCIDSAGNPVAISGSGIIRLWHPIAASADEVDAWRDRLMARGIVQPFRQVWREVYRLTDAEQQTATYSNRFAGHVIKQHQMMALAIANGWHCQQRTGFDSADDQPTWIPIPAYGLQAEYWTSAFKERDLYTRGGSYLYLKTDRLKFHAFDGKAPHKRGTERQLAQVPDRIFSEIMRHCDLFTSVASIGLDPEWTDRGPNALHPTHYDGAHRYWLASHEAPLAPTAQQRGEMLKALLPSLAQAGRLSVGDKHLEVAGKRHRYLIHLGSAGVIIDGQRRHVCIVPANLFSPAKMALPFDSDSTMALILSKAFLLLDDDKIDDPVILGQIN